ncbi:MAG: protoglobin domain-containing protein [Mariprofundaceae bacterium]
MAYEEVIEERIRFLQIDRSTASTMQQAQNLIEDAIDDSLDKFYAHILQEPTLKTLFSDEDAVKSARSAQKHHWLKTLFTENLGKSQFDQAERIGQAHMRIGLTPSWYMSGYCFMLNQFVEIIADHYKNDAKGLSQVIQALNKMVFLDMHFVIDSYLDAKDRCMREMLLRATRFTEDVEGLNQELATTVQDLQARTKELVTRDETLKEQASQMHDVLRHASTTGVEFSESSADDHSAPLANPQLEKALDRITTLVDEVGTAGSSTQPVLECSGQLSAQVKKMDERLKQLQFGDKLYSPLGKEESFLARVKVFISKQLQGKS